MTNTNQQLYRWVKSAERLPTRKAEYYTKVDDDYKSVGIFDGYLFYSNDNIQNATEWLEPLPSHEVGECGQVYHEGVIRDKFIYFLKVQTFKSQQDKEHLANEFIASLQNKQI